MRSGLQDLTSVFVVGDAEGEGVQAFDELVKGTSRGEFTPPSLNVGEDLSMLIYTSGTTGKPKGAMIAQTQVVKAGGRTPWASMQALETFSSVFCR